jgi:5-methylcytosine-specific restriction enzyme B
VRLHFGWRTVSDIIGFLQVAAAGATLSPREALDQAIYSKVLPKLRGEDSVRLRGALTTAASVMQQQSLPLASGKVAELLDDLRQMGSARFWR